MRFSETLGVRTTEAVFLSVSFKVDLINLSKMITIHMSLDERMRFIITFTDEPSALKCTSFLLQFSFLEIGASFHGWPLLSEIHIRNLLCQFIPFSFGVFWILFKVPFRSLFP